ncbi:MAG TPA: DUF2793 domain-containing protein, partial [Candidatus Aminicenantes bacterium]|nr:DUF2793 domain-containing protein [Candidatus Aminicenantes bacterium]
MTIYRAPDLDTFAWQPPVKDKDLTSPPGSPTKGDRYIVGASATGDWAGHDNQIAYYSGSAWVFLTLAEGQMCWVEDENKVYKYDGSAWAVLVPESSGGLGYALQGAGANLASVSDGATYYFGGQPALVPSNISAYHRFYVPKAGTI